MRTHHAKEVSGKAKHAQVSTEDNVFEFREAVFHCLNLPTLSKFDALAMKMQLATSEAEDNIKVKTANVRG